MKLSLLGAVGLLLLSSCRSTPTVPRPFVADETTFLGLAVVEASRLPDELARAELYRQITLGYQATGDEASMRSVAGAGLQLARAAGPTEQSIRVRLGLAPLLAAAGEDASAQDALEAGLRFVSSAEDPEVRAELVPLLVHSALRSDEPARPILRRSVEEAYVIDDPEHRAEALIRIAEVYQAAETFLSVTSFIHQASPAVRSVPGRFTRAQLFARLADLAERSGEAVLAARLISSAIEEVDMGGGPTSEDESRHLVTTVTQVAGLRRRDDALRLVELFALPQDAVRAMIGISEAAQTRAARLDHLRHASQLAQRVEDTAQFTAVHIRLAAAYYRVAASSRANEHADRAAQVLASAPDLYAGIELPGELAQVLVRMDRLQAVRELLLQAPDEYVRGAVSVRAAEQLIADGRLGLADDFLTIALIASDEATYLADSLRRAIVAGFARTGSIRLAIRTVERMTDARLRAEAVTVLAVVAEPTGAVIPMYRADLASVLATR